jgi:hypothetical protein
MAGTRIRGRAYYQAFPIARAYARPRVGSGSPSVAPHCKRDWYLCVLKAMIQGRGGCRHDCQLELELDGSDGVSKGCLGHSSASWGSLGWRRLAWELL